MFKFCCNRSDNVFAFIQYKEQLNVDKKKITKSQRKLGKICAEEFYCKTNQIVNTNIKSYQIYR